MSETDGPRLICHIQSDLQIKVRPVLIYGVTLEDFFLEFQMDKKLENIILEV